MFAIRTTNEVRRSSDQKSTVAIINTGALDRHGTIIEPMGISLDNYRKNPVFLINHNYNMLAGNGAVVRLQDGKLVAEVPDDAWDKDDPEVMRWYNKVKNGKCKMTSIGITYSSDDVEVETRNIDGQDMEIPIIRKCELSEFSWVSVGSNPEALIVQRNLSNDLAASIEEIKNHILELTKTVSRMPDHELIRAIIQESIESNQPPAAVAMEPEETPEPAAADQTADRIAMIRKITETAVDNLLKKQGIK